VKWQISGYTSRCKKKIKDDSSVNPYSGTSDEFRQIEKGGYDHFMLRYMSNLASLKILIEEVTRKQRAYSNVWS
jgi:hypothetical protein